MDCTYCLLLRTKEEVVELVKDKIRKVTTGKGHKLSELNPAQPRLRLPKGGFFGSLKKGAQKGSCKEICKRDVEPGR
jgi:hypothetical protein